MLARVIIAIITLVLSVISLAGTHNNAKKDKDGNWISPVKKDKADTVLVVGATGQVGRLVVHQLVGLNQNVRVLVRSKAKAEKYLPPQAIVFEGDVTKPETLPAAFDGVDYVISTVGAGGAKKDPISNPETVDFQGVTYMVDASKAAGVKQFVLLSSMGVTQPDHFLNRMMHNVLQWKLKGENHLRESGVPYTIIRPGALSNTPGGKKQIIFIQGDPKRNGVIARADVARMIVNALVDNNAINKTVEIIWDKKSTNGQIDWAKAWAELKEDT